MSNPTFTTAVAGTPPPDPSKHVNFTQGMVLGVQDFQQEFAYLSNRTQWPLRDTIGYGTLCGLHVSLDPADYNSISVSPGVAVNPRGQLIRVAPRQCARLDAWLALPATTDRMNTLGLGTSGDFTAYVVLCYRDCPTDELPVPGEPCRCDSDTMAASRIQDDFRLELTLEPPPQLEEDAIRDFVSWLREVEIADFNPAPGELETFLQAIRDALCGVTSPPESPPDFFYGSPPAGLRIPRRLLCEWMRAALRLWVTDLRPLWQAQCAPQKACACGGPCGCHGSGAQPDDMACDCLLLAAVRIKRGSSGITGAELDEEHRPYVVHLRMLQELLLCGPSCCDSCGDSRTFATVLALDQQTLQIWIHHPVQLSLPDAAVTVELGGVTITDFTISPSASPPGLNLFDLILTGSPVDIMGNSVMVGLEFDASHILEPGGRDLATAIWQDSYCYGDYIEPQLRVFAASGTLLLGGDVVGPPANNQLDFIHGEPIDLTGLGDKQALGHDNNQWHPVAVPQPATQVPKALAPVGSKGTSANNYAFEDHVHPGPLAATQVPKALALAGSKGTSVNNYALEDHVHPGPLPATQVPKTLALAGSKGTSVNNYALEDHVHPGPQPATISPKAPAATALKGTSLNNYALEDHVHPLQQLAGDFVEYPPFGFPYAIVAAGLLFAQKKTVDPSYNELRFVRVLDKTPGQLLQGPNLVLTYGPPNSTTPLKGYVQPKTNHAYIIKATGFGTTTSLLTVTSFEEDGFVVNFGQAQDVPSVSMIEVSMYSLKAVK